MLKKVAILGAVFAGLIISDLATADTVYYPVTRREARHIRHYDRTHPCTKVVYRKVCKGRWPNQRCYMQKRVYRVC